MRPIQPSVVAVQRHVMLSAVPSSGIVNSMIRITGIGDHDRPEWLIRISGMRTSVFRRRPARPIASSPSRFARNPPPTKMVCVLRHSLSRRKQSE